MSAPKHPNQLTLALPKLSDPNNVPEVFANHAVGIGIRDGVAHITFSVIRPRHSGSGGAGDEENVVVSRIALPGPTLNALVSAYSQLQSAIQLQQVLKPN